MSRLDESNISVAMSASGSVASRGWWKWILDPQGGRKAWAAAVFLGILVGYGLWLGSSYLNVDARLLDVHAQVPILMLGLAVVVVLIAGQFDLSVASMATLTTFLTVGLRVKDGLPMWLVIVICITVGVAGGAFNGFAVVSVRVNAFIATLASGGVFLGISAVYSGGNNISPEPDLTPIPGWFTGSDSLGAFSNTIPEPIVWLAFVAAVGYGGRAMWAARPADWSRERWLLLMGGIAALAVGVAVIIDLPYCFEQVSWMIGVLLAVGLALWVFVQHTVAGRNLRATGQNATAARLAGVKVDRSTFFAFVLTGGLAALAGILLAANTGSASQSVATPYLLPAFAAAFLSTVLFSNGQFTIWGTIGGGILLVWVSQGLVVGGLNFTWTEIVNGIVLFGAVAIASYGRPARRA